MNTQLRSFSGTGFTLLEMLIVLALLSMLMLALTGIILVGIMARGRVTEVTVDQQDFSAFERLVTNELGRAYPDWIKEGNIQCIDFNGASDNVVFLAPALDSQGQGLAYYSLSIVREDGQNAILLKTMAVDGDVAPSLTTHFAIGLESLHLAYFGASSNAGAPSWQYDWKTRQTMPELIAVQVSFPKVDRRSWPTVIIHPEIDADITCQIDPETHTCAGR